MTEPVSTSNENGGTTAPPADQVKPLLTNLFYPSESDEPVEWVTCYFKMEGPLTVSQIKDWLMLPPSVSVEERPEADFWQPVTVDEEWYGDDEKARTGAFKELNKAMDALTDRQFFQVDETEVDLYLLGRVPDGSRAGLKTKVIET